MQSWCVRAARALKREDFTTRSGRSGFPLEPFFDFFFSFSHCSHSTSESISGRGPSSCHTNFHFFFSLSHWRNEIHSFFCSPPSLLGTLESAFSSSEAKLIPRTKKKSPFLTQFRPEPRFRSPRNPAKSKAAHTGTRTRAVTTHTHTRSLLPLRRVPSRKKKKPSAAAQQQKKKEKKLPRNCHPTKVTSAPEPNPHRYRRFHRGRLAHRLDHTLTAETRENGPKFTHENPSTEQKRNVQLCLNNG